MACRYKIVKGAYIADTFDGGCRKIRSLVGCIVATDSTQKDDPGYVKARISPGHRHAGQWLLVKTAAGNVYAQKLELCQCGAEITNSDELCDRCTLTQQQLAQQPLAQQQLAQATWDIVAPLLKPLRLDVDSLRASAEMAWKDNERLRAEIAVLKSSFDGCKFETELLRREVATLKASLVAGQKRINESLRTDLDALKASLNEGQKGINKPVRSDVDALTASCGELQKTVNAMADGLHGVEVIVHGWSGATSAAHHTCEAANAAETRAKNILEAMEELASTGVPGIELSAARFLYDEAKRKSSLCRSDLEALEAMDAATRERHPEYGLKMKEAIAASETSMQERIDAVAASVEALSTRLKEQLWST